MPLSPESMRERIKAVVVVQATPMNRDGSLDLSGLKANTQFLSPALTSRVSSRFEPYPTAGPYARGFNE